MESENEIDQFGRPYPAKQGGYHIPQLAADSVVIRLNPGGFHEVLLVTRGHFPYVGKLAFPGGRINYNEDPKVGCLRELKEECGIEGKILDLLTVQGDPQRDPRGHVISVFYLVEVDANAQIVAGDDATQARFYALGPMLESPNLLAFDHHKILQIAASRLPGRYQV
ncbi:unnamed protein product [Blepharisma stoltei]|uniref:Nudix hydrolase domain-containing protein n=1 Tax=Blepharisma stoltei TaxID=1481888 RepID=A0AAU9JPF6_9CILI|nr:unnamed protein product [Blepharisma stoltei]